MPILDTDSGTGESPIRAAVEVHSEGYESEHSNSNSNSNGNSNSNRNSNSNSEPEELADEVMYDPLYHLCSITCPNHKIPENSKSDMKSLPI